MNFSLSFYLKKKIAIEDEKYRMSFNKIDSELIII